MSLKVWLPLNGDLHNQGTLNIVANFCNATINTAGKIGSCYYFDGTNMRIQYPHDKTVWNNKEISICMWYKYAEGNTTNTMIDIAADLCLSYTYSSSQVRFNYWRAYSNNGTRTGDSGSGNYYDASKWHHVVLTCDHGINKIYVDGILDATFDRSSKYTTNWVPLLGTNYNSIMLAKSAGSSPFGSGYLNDVRIYDHCLSAAEVHDIAQGLVLHYKLDGGVTIAKNLIKNGYGELGTTNWNSSTSFSSEVPPNHPGIKLIDLADDIDSTTISDSSGYGHNGKIINTLNIFSNTPKYEASTYFSNSAHIKTLNFNFPSNIWTVSCWYYRDTNPSTYEAIFCLSKGNGADANKKIAAVPNSGRIWFKGESGSLSISKLNISTWTMLTMTCDGTTVKIYENNSPIGSFSAGSQMTECTDLIIGARANSSNATSIAVPYTGGISDFRIYCTPLLDNDIKSLYNIGMRVDNLQNIHTFELNENGTNKLTKTGILYDNIIEPYLTLPDGSNWKLLLYHYVDNGNNLFTKTNATYCNDFGLYSRLKDINNYTYDSKYEYYVIQDGKEFRWTQTSSPTATSITGLTTVSGYNNPVNGLAKPSSLTQTYIGYNAWWGACGCWTKYSTGGKTGIPGFGSHDGNGICTNYLALYTRIEKPKAEIANENIYAENLIEF